MSEGEEDECMGLSDEEERGVWRGEERRILNRGKL